MTELAADSAAEAVSAQPAKKTAKKAAKKGARKSAAKAAPEPAQAARADQPRRRGGRGGCRRGALPPRPRSASPACCSRRPTRPAPPHRVPAAAPRRPPARRPPIRSRKRRPLPTRPRPAAEPDSAGTGPAAAEGDDTGEGGAPRKRRRRGGRGRRGRSDESGTDTETKDSEDDVQTEGGTAAKRTGAEADAGSEDADQGPTETDGEDAEDEGGSASSRRRRRRRRRAGSGEDGSDDPPGTVTKVRQPRKPDDQVASVKGSTRLEAKKQRRREGRDAGRRKPIITESEFLARRESVDRTMIVRERAGRTQIAVLEDDVLVEHYVANETNASMIGNVYLGRVQNVLPSMEAAFIDIGKGRNAVLYAGEVNWDAAGMEGQPRRIEAALKSGDQVLVQVTKDPMGHKGARLTSQISLPGRYLVYVPNGSMTGISRKLPDTERTRLKRILKAVVPEQAGVIVRTAAEGASEEELQRDVERLTAQWETIEKKSKSSAGGSAPKLLHGEPDLTVRVIRDVFNEDFNKLVVSGGSAWDVVQPYVDSVAPDLAERISKWTPEQDVFAAHRVDEQLAKAMDRKVWLPSGGSLVIDRTEAMTVVDVNTGKFTGSGGNLEETVTRNNLEAAEEIVRQLRLRDIGGIIVVDFIDMVLESNRDLVLRRLLECLGRDRTKHQVAEVTSLGLVQMTRKRVGQGLLEVFSEPCEHCNGRGILVHAEPVQSKNGAKGGGDSDKNDGGRGSGKSEAKGEGGGSRSRRGRGKSADAESPAPAAQQPPAPPRQPIPAGLVASLAHHHDDHHDDTSTSTTTSTAPSTPLSQPPSPPRWRRPWSRRPWSRRPPPSRAVVEAPALEAPAVEAPAVAQEAEQAPEPQPAKAPRRRRRASAPAGPPVPAAD